MENDVFKRQVGGEHYMRFKYQPIQFIMDIHADFPTGCVIKYVTRYEFKDGIRDLEKAKQNIDFITTKIENENYQMMLVNDWQYYFAKYNSENQLSKMQNLIIWSFLRDDYQVSKSYLDELIRLESNKTLIQ